MNYRQLEREFGENSNVAAFAEACINANTIDELKNALNSNVDSADLKAWGITAEEWKIAIEAALTQKIEYLEE